MRRNRFPSFIEIPLGIALFRLHGGAGLRRRQDVGATLLQRLLRLDQAPVHAVDDRLLLVVRLLLVRQRLRGFTQINFRCTML